jgi:glycosyltransferase involved in cell wall biosynthesis
LGGELHSPPVVGMLALLTPWKGHRVLLEAARTLGNVEVEFAGGHFPGDEDYVAELRARASQPDLKGRVRFLGHMDAEAALSRWDAAISASVSPEAGPLSVLEAMSYGVPVIGSDHGGTSEFLREGAGVLVPSGDPASLAIAIKRVLSDHDLRREISDRARRRAADDHNIDVTLPLLLAKILS